MRILARLMLASLLAGSLQSMAVAEPKSGGTLTYGVTGEPPSTDCHAITTYAGTRTRQVRRARVPPQRTRPSAGAH